MTPHGPLYLLVCVVEFRGEAQFAARIAAITPASVSDRMMVHKKFFAKGHPEIAH